MTGFFAHGLSWIVLLAIALHKPFTIDLPALAWVHIVALGWLTMIALSVLIHAIPTFTDVGWKGESFARRALAIYACGVAALVAAFWWRDVALVPWAATLVLIGLCGYLVPAARTLVAGYGGPRLEAAIARALSLTFGALIITAALGLVLGWALAGRLPATLLVAGPPIHAAFGTIGWLTVLVMGISTRTVRPIVGARSRVPWAHPVAGAAESGGLVVLSAGLATEQISLAWAGAATIVAGAVLYVVDLADVLRRASNPHRPPQAFIGTAIFWLVAGLALALGTLAGNWSGAAAVYVLLVGWLGQMVNGHLYHIGVRLIATMARGDDDETEPRELLTQPLSWLSFGLFQCAVALGAAGVLLNRTTLLEAGAVCGLAGWLAMAVNILSARRRASAEPPAPPSKISPLRTVLTSQR